MGKYYLLKLMTVIISNLIFDIKACWVTTYSLNYYVLCAGAYTIKNATIACNMNGYDLASYDLNILNSFSNKYQLTDLINSTAFNFLNDTGIYKYRACQVKNVNHNNTLYDKNFVQANTFSVSLWNVLDYEFYVKAVYATPSELSCENVTTLFMSGLNETIVGFDIIFSTLESVNVSSLDIIDYWKNEAMLNIQEVKNALYQIKSPLYYLLLLRKGSNEDLITSINTVEFLTLKVYQNMSWQAFSRKVAYNDVAKVINQYSYPTLYSTFYYLSIINYYTTLSVYYIYINLLNMVKYNDAILFIRFQYCDIALNKLLDELLVISDTNRAFYQFQYFFDHYSGYPGILSVTGVIFQTFADNRYNLFLCNELNATICEPLNETSRFNEILQSLMLTMNDPLSAIWSLKTTNNDTLLQNMLENTSKTLDTTVSMMKTYKTQIRDLNCTNFNQTNNQVNDLIYILEIAFNYTNTIINTKPVNFTSIKRLSNLFDKTTVVNTYITNTAYNSLYGLWYNTYYFNYYSSLFDASTISYKTIIYPTTYYINLYNYYWQIYSTNSVNLTFYDLFYQFQYLGNSFENLSSQYSQQFIFLSNNMRSLSYYFNTLNIKLANFSIQMNDTNYINETEAFIIEFIKFTETSLFLNTTQASSLASLINPIRLYISTALNNIYDALDFVYIPPTTSTTTTTVTQTTSTSTTSTTKTTTTTTQTTTTSATSNSDLNTGVTLAELSKCGGIGYTGITECAVGLTCYVQNDYYSQCLTGTCPTGWSCSNTTAAATPTLESTTTTTQTSTTSTTSTRSTTSSTSTTSITSTTSTTSNTSTTSTTSTTSITSISTTSTSTTKATTNVFASIISSSSSSFQTTLTWNTWNPWCYCIFFRSRYNLITKEVFNVTLNVSCNLISNNNEVLAKVETIANEKKQMTQAVDNITNTKLAGIKEKYVNQIYFNDNLGKVAIIIVASFAVIFILNDLIKLFQNMKILKCKKRKRKEFEPVPRVGNISNKYKEVKISIEIDLLKKFNEYMNKNSNKKQ